MEIPIVDSDLLLRKFPGKGGWTYAEIPHALAVEKSSFGWVRVKGKIDNLEINGYNLAPMKGGKLFLPVKAEVRKEIKKQAGDYIKVILFKDDSIFEIPAELLDCLKIEERALSLFEKLSESRKKEYVKWIYSAKLDETKADRINKMIDKLLQRKTLMKST